MAGRTVQYDVTTRAVAPDVCVVERALDVVSPDQWCHFRVRLRLFHLTAAQLTRTRSRIRNRTAGLACIPNGFWSVASSRGNAGFAMGARLALLQMSVPTPDPDTGQVVRRARRCLLP